MANLRRIEQTKFKSKLISFIFSQISILLFGTLAGCWVTVGMQPQLVSSGDSQIILIRNLGILFTILFIITMILTIVFYMIYKDRLDISKFVNKNQPNTTVKKQMNTNVNAQPKVNVVKTTTVNNMVKPSNALATPNVPRLVNKKVTIQETSKKITTSSPTINAGVKPAAKVSTIAVNNKVPSVAPTRPLNVSPKINSQTTTSVKKSI